VYENNHDEYPQVMVRGIFKQPHPELDMQHVIEESRKTPATIGMAMLMMDVFGVDRRAALKKIDRPALIIAPADSPSLDIQKGMAGEIPGAKLAVIPGSGHAVFIDQPEKFDEALGQLLKRAGE